MSTSPLATNRTVEGEGLAARFSSWLGKPVLLKVTENRNTVLSYRRTSACLELRIHGMFLEAPEPVLRAVVEFAGQGLRAAEAVVDAFIEENQERVLAEQAARSANPMGRFFNLQAMYEELNREHFEGSIRAAIGWARWPSRRAGRAIRLGVYDYHAREIRIHPVLDCPKVPAFFVKFVIFHEMLHQLIPAQRAARKMVHHPPAFLERERTFPQYQEAIRWEAENLELLFSRG